MSEVPGYRPEVVEGIADSLDDVNAAMRDGVLGEIIPDTTRVEQAALARILNERTIAELTEAGVLVRRPAPTVLDATNRQLQAVAAVWGAISRWNVSCDPDKRLGDLLKVLPEDAVRWIGGALVLGGLLEVPEAESPS